MSIIVRIEEVYDDRFANSEGVEVTVRTDDGREVVYDVGLEIVGQGRRGDWWRVAPSEGDLLHGEHESLAAALAHLIQKRPCRGCDDLGEVEQHAVGVHASDHGCGPIAPCPACRPEDHARWERDR